MFYFRAIAVAIYTIYRSVASVLDMSFSGDGSVFYSHSQKWGSRFLKLGGVRLEVEGFEKLDPSKNYVIAANHSSYFDIPILLSQVPRTGIMYKKSLEKAPILGMCLRRSPLISVERSDPRSAMRSVALAIEAIRRGEGVIVFPEGTRSKTGELGPFKRGAFMLAARSEKPIVPTAIVGANKIMPANSSRIRPGTAKLIFGEPIETPKGITTSEEKELMRRVREEIAALLEKNSFEPRK